MPLPRPTLLESLPLAGGILLTARARQQAHARGIDPAQLARLLEQPERVGACRRRGRQWLAAPVASPAGVPAWIGAVVQPSAHGLLVLRVFRRRSLPGTPRAHVHAPLHARARRRQRLLARTGQGA